jgi:hypothetical protein
MDKIISMSAFILYGVGLLGIVAHAIKKWMMKEINYSVYDYLFTQDPRGSMLTVFTVLGAILTAVGTGQISNVHAFSDVSVAFLAGFAADSAIYPATTGAKST